MNYTIIIEPTGNIKGMDIEGCNFKPMGKAKVERASSIVWLERFQRWAVKILVGPFAGKFLDVLMFYPINFKGTTVGVIWTFTEYSEAKKAEIQFFEMYIKEI